MSKAPEICIYCKGTGESTAGGSCGFCMGGKPLDTQEDWDRTWGKTISQEGIDHLIDRARREFRIDIDQKTQAEGHDHSGSKPLPYLTIGTEVRHGNQIFRVNGIGGSTNYLDCTMVFVRMATEQEMSTDE